MDNSTLGIETFLHLYRNNKDEKDHLALVFGDSIRSRSLHAQRQNETEKDRVIRGAYTTGQFRRRQPSTSETNPSADGESAKGHPEAVDDTPLVRVHSECFTGETTWSARCDCGEQLDQAARLISQLSSPNGVIIYLRQEGRGIGLENKLRAYNLQDLGLDTVEANEFLRLPVDARSYGIATAILCDLGLGGKKGIRLLTNNPEKMKSIGGPESQIFVREVVPMIPTFWRNQEVKGLFSSEIVSYLRTKIEKMGHLLKIH
jgi:GTP cyclohydrolase II